MAKYEKQFKGNFVEVANHIHENIMKNGISMNLVDESNFECEGTNIIIRVYDKYYARNGSRASLNVTIVGKDENIFVSAISAGGGKGVFFNFSLGAESEMVDIVKNSIQHM